MCADAGLIVPATVCDHITPHKGNVALFWSGPFQSLCAPCHNRHKSAEERSGKAKAIIGLDGWPVEPQRQGFVNHAHPEWFKPLAVSLTIVCGPPASGKTTFVAKHKNDADIVLDLDAIAVRRFRKPAAMLTPDQRIACLKERNQQLANLMAPECQGKYRMAWLIVSEPAAAKRQWWQDTMQPVSIIVLETPTDECIARASADTRQQRPADTPSRVAAWWQTYAPRKGEIVIKPESIAVSA
jgi:5-methylcytosine-specific restriction protein A